MVSAKDEMLTQYMRACMDRFSSDDLKFLEEKFWAVSFNFSVNMITRDVRKAHPLGVGWIAQIMCM